MAFLLSCSLGPPRSRHQRDRMSTMTTSTSLDEEFTSRALETGISVNKLKAVYFRGVDAFYLSSSDAGTPTMWGLARVQRFINAVTRGDNFYEDSDLNTGAASVDTSDRGVTIAIDASELVSDVLYRSGANTAAMFYPGVVDNITLEDCTIIIAGTLDDQVWQYELDTISGDHNFFIE